MTVKFKTKDVAKAHYVNFRKKAEECFRAAQNSFTRQDWNAAAINVIYCCISTCDAMCVYFLGKRHSGEEINANANRILRILRMKNMAEYEGRLVYKSEAEKILRDCERFWEFVQGELPKG